MSNWIYVNVMSSGGANKEGANALRSCANLVSFIPAVGATYQVVQSVPVSGCVVDVTDKSTGGLSRFVQKRSGYRWVFALTQ